MPINHASDSLTAGGIRKVSFSAVGQGMYAWSADKPDTVVELASVSSQSFPSGGPLSYFSEPPSTSEAGYTFFASRTRDQPGGVKAAIFHHDGTALNILAETATGSDKDFNAFTDPCMDQDESGAAFVSYVSLDHDGRKSWMVQWVGEHKSEPVRVLRVDDHVGGCGSERVDDMPNAPPACTRGAASVVVVTSGSRSCSGVHGVRVLAPGKFELISQPLVDARAKSSDGHHLVTWPKTGRGALARGADDSLVACVFGVLDDRGGTFGVYRTEGAL